MPERCAPATQTTLLPVNESFKYFRFKIRDSYVELINTIGLRRVNPVGQTIFSLLFKFPVVEFDSFLLGLTLPSMIEVASDSLLLAGTLYPLLCTHVINFELI